MRAIREIVVCAAWLSVFVGGGCGGTNSSDTQVSLGADGDLMTTGGAAGGTGGMSGAGSSAASGNQPGAPNQQPTFAPNFPGAGTSGADAPLMNGQLCDYVPLKGDLPTADQVTTCYFDKNGDPVPAATMEQVLECVDGKDVVHLRLTFNPDFVDNTYGTGSIGWPAKRGHRFKDLTGSDPH